MGILLALISLDFIPVFVRIHALAILSPCFPKEAHHEDSSMFAVDASCKRHPLCRELELLVEAGFTPVEAIHIYSANGASWLGQSDRIGTLAPGKQADLVVIHGNPAARISDIEKVEIVFKDGIGYDSAKLIESVRGAVGLH